MEENINISLLNDFIFCPRSIYFHNLYYPFDETLYHSTYQKEGKSAHKNIDEKNYSSKKDLIEGLDVYSEELGLVGKIDLLDLSSNTLIERKKRIKQIYEGYYLQVYAHYFCLIEMNYKVRSIKLHSLVDNKRYNVALPGYKDKNRIAEIIQNMKSFDLSKPFKQNPNKCKMCIYKEMCDCYDEQT